LFLEEAMTKVGRNDPCPCGSGKKYKKCCEEKGGRKKFHAEVLTPASVAEPQTTQHTSKVSSLFFQKTLPSLAPKPKEPVEEPKNPVM
jgi:hypothetical protein